VILDQDFSRVQLTIQLRSCSFAKVKNNPLEEIMRRIILGLVAMSAIGACTVSSDNGGENGYEVIAANQNAISIKTSWGGFGDAGADLANEHCGKYGRVAQYESGTKAGFNFRYTYLCR
jgi:hypothetical protein